MNDEINYKILVDRFLGWKLPKDFNPDGGISYTKSPNTVSPIGTNLFTATQAEQMIRCILNDSQGVSYDD